MAITKNLKPPGALAKGPRRNLRVPPLRGYQFVVKLHIEAMRGRIKEVDKRRGSKEIASIEEAYYRSKMRLSNDIYSLVDNNKTAKDLWDALARHMPCSEYGEQDRKAAVLSKIAFENANLSLRVELIPTKIKYANKRFMNYIEEQTDEEAMISSIKNGDQPLPHVTQVSIAGTTSTKQPPLKDKSMWSDQEKRVQKIDHLARSLLIQVLSNDIYSLIDSNMTAKDLWDALARHMLGSE
nr:hypothetical protein [Tanacetum cinerariifolium]